MGTGLLAEDGFGESEGGRRSSLLHIPREAGLVVGVDLGATSVDVALTTLGGHLVAHWGAPADVREGPRVVLEKVKAILGELLAEQGADSGEVLTIGVGVPGPVEYATGLPTSPPIMPGWDRFPVRGAFAGEYAAPVFVDNDVNVMALGEHRGGVGKGIANMLFVKVGTGVGCGIITGGDIYRGTQGCAGDIGHICVDPDGPICSCGNAGCLEAMAAGPGILEEAARRAGQEPGSDFAAAFGNGGFEARDVLEAAARGDHQALNIVRRSGRLVGQTLATLVSVLNPSLIVIGGGIAIGGSHTLLAEIRSAVYHRSLPLATRNLPIVLSELGETAGVVGASALAVEGALVAGG